MFLLLAPVALPTGLALAGLVWAWWNCAITAEPGGITAPAPVTSDARQWTRQIRAAHGLAAAPSEPVPPVPAPRREAAPEPWPVPDSLVDIVGSGAPR